MGSTNLVPGTGSFGNPAGMDAYGLNPLGDLEYLKSLASFNPGNESKQATILGAGKTSGSPFVNVNPTSLVPSSTPQTSPFQVAGVGGNTNTWKPQVPSQNTIAPAGSNYGYPVNTTTLNNAVDNIPSPSWYGNVGWGTQGQLRDLYGEGLGDSINSVLMNGAGYNPQIASAFINAIQPYFQSNLGNIMSQFGAAGARFSSSAALAAGKAGADFTAQEQSLMAQMYMWAYQNFLGVLTGSAKDFANAGSGGDIFSTIQSILGLGKTAATGLTAAGVGGGGGTLASILAGVAAL